MLRIGYQNVIAAVERRFYAHVQRMGGVLGKNKIFRLTSEHSGELFPALIYNVGGGERYFVRGSAGVSAAVTHNGGNFRNDLRGLRKGSRGIVEIYYLFHRLKAAEP